MRHARILLPIVVLLLGSLLFSGCRSAHVDMTVANRSGSAIRLLEVDYPDASFGDDSLAAGAVFHYRVQLQGKGSLKVQYTSEDGHQHQITGPSFSEGQQGTLMIGILPDGKAEFQPNLTPGH